MQPTPKAKANHFPTKHNCNRNWSPRYQDGKHKPKAKK